MLSKRERHRRARDQRTAHKLIDIADEINATRCLVNVGRLAAQGLGSDDAGPMAELMETISNRLRGIVSSMEAQQEGATDAA